MAITVSGPVIVFDDTSVAQSIFYNETFGTGVFPEGGTSLTIQGGTEFTSSATAGNGKIATVVGVKTDASVILTTPQSGSVTVNPIVSGVYVFAVGGGGGGGGCSSPIARITGSSGIPSFFSTVIGNGGSSSGTATGGAGGTATGGTANTSGSAGGTAVTPGVGGGIAGSGGNAGGFPNGIAGAGGARAPAVLFNNVVGSPGTPFGGGGGGGTSTALVIGIGAAGGGGGGLAIHPRLTITGGSSYSYRVGDPGAGAPGTGGGGAGGIGYLKFILYD